MALGGFYFLLKPWKALGQDFILLDELWAKHVEKS